MTSEAAGLVASVHQRLLNQSRARGVDFNSLLSRYAIERLLQDPEKIRQWTSFLTRSRLNPLGSDFPTVIAATAQFLVPVLDAARTGSTIAGSWPPGGPWVMDPVQPPDGLQDAPLTPPATL